MRLSNDCVLRRLESPSAYNMKKDELYALDEEGYAFLAKCSVPVDAAKACPEFVEYCMDEGILVGHDKGPYAWPTDALEAPLPSLRYLEVLLTDRCNLKCRHCYLGEAGQRELSVPDFAKVLSDFERMGGLKVMLSGGEPLTHSGFWDMNEILPGYGLRKVLLTNGVLINAAVVGRLNVHEVQVSVDGLERSHDRVRGKGTFKRAMEAIRLLKENGMDVSVATMATRENKDDFPGMRSLFESMGIREWAIDAPCEKGYLEENRDLLLNHREAGALMDFAFSQGSHGSSPGYACGSHLMCATPEGAYARCGFFRDEPLGEIHDGMMKSWGSLHHWRLTELACDCPHMDDCRGGCRYRAYLNYGTFSAPDPVFCAMYGVETKTSTKGGRL